MQCRRLGFLILLLLGIAPVQAIVIRHDRADSRYVIDAEQYPQLFYLHTRLDKRICMATLIAPDWAITAAHCLEETPILDTLGQNEPWQLDVAGETYHIAELVVHPHYVAGPILTGVDLALLRLDRKVAGVEPIVLNRNRDEADNVAFLLGWGHTGLGTTGRQHNDGKFRRAMNLVSKADQWLRFRFDDPREPDSLALALEGIPGLGDSGGPALLETVDGTILIGVALGELTTDGSHSQRSHYGATEIYERVSLHLDWIDQTLGPQLASAP